MLEFCFVDAIYVGRGVYLFSEGVHRRSDLHDCMDHELILQTCSCIFSATNMVSEYRSVIRKIF